MPIKVDARLNIRIMSFYARWREVEGNWFFKYYRTILHNNKYYLLRVLGMSLLYIQYRFLAQNRHECAAKNIDNFMKNVGKVFVNEKT